MPTPTGPEVDTADGSAVSFAHNNYYDGTNYSTTQGAKLALGLVVGKIYEVVMFQAERNECGSNFGITLKNFGKPKSVCTSKCGDAVVAADEACDLGTAANTGTYRRLHGHLHTGSLLWRSQHQRQRAVRRRRELERVRQPDQRLRTGLQGRAELRR